ncbi:MAG: hypothetical protein ACRDBM_02600 [Sporomusa sp.]
MINNVQELRAAIGRYTNIPYVVGIHGINADKNYRKGQTLSRSYYTMGSDLNPRYVEKTHNFLSGTSAIGLANVSEIAGMEDDELLVAVRDAIKSTYGERLCIIVGDQQRDGEAEREWIIGVKEWPTVLGAIYVDDISPEF